MTAANDRNEQIEMAFSALERVAETGRMSVPLSRFRPAFEGWTYRNEELGVPDGASLADVDLPRTATVMLDRDVICFHRLSVVDAKSVHDLCHESIAFSGRRLFRFDTAGVWPDRRLDAVSVVLIESRQGFACVGGLAAGKSARQSKGIRTFLPKLTEIANAAIPMILAIDFARELCWSVSFSIPGLGASIAFLTDAIGVREALAMRDLEPGKQRRAALVHWVSAHNRKRRDDSAAVLAVRQHLRGRWQCSLSGMQVEIGAPPDEIRRAIQAADA